MSYAKFLRAMFWELIKKAARKIEQKRDRKNDIFSTNHTYAYRDLKHKKLNIKLL